LRYFNEIEKNRKIESQKNRKYIGKYYKQTKMFQKYVPSVQTVSLLTTSLYLFPSIYGFYQGKFVLPAISAATSLTSVLQLMNPDHKVVYFLHMNMARVGTCIYFMESFHIIQPIWMRFGGFFALYTIVQFTANAELLRQMNSPAWLYYRIACHYLSSLTQSMVLYYLVNP